MARLILFAVVLFAAVFPLKAADRPFCHADEVRAATLKAQPEVQQTIDSIGEAIRSYVAVEPRQRLIASGSTSSAYIIPAIVYVVHDGGAEKDRRSPMHRTQRRTELTTGVAASATIFGPAAVEALAVEQTTSVA